MSNSEYLKAFLCIAPSRIKTKAVISPILFPSQFDKESKGRASKSALGYIVCNCHGFTFIKIPMLQSAVADLVRVLQFTACKEIVFIGAIGAISESLEIGDIYATNKAHDIYSFGSILDETTDKLLALKHKGVVGVDFESRSFFREAKKAGYKVSALYIVTDLPLKKPFYRKRSKRETLKITHAIEQIKQQLGKL